MNLNDLNKIEICNRCCIVDVIDYFRHEFLLLLSILKLLFVFRNRYLVSSMLLVEVRISLCVNIRL